MVLKSCAEIFAPLWSLSSMNVWIPLKRKASYKWLTKPWRVSSPLKLKKTSKFSGWWVKEEEEAPLLITRAIRIYEQTVVKIWNKERENCERVVNIKEFYIWTMQSRTMEIKITFVYFKQAQQELREKERGKLEERKSFMKNHITCLNEC